MKRLVVFCEGETERGFCNRLLHPHLAPDFRIPLHTILIAHSRHHGRVSRGGVSRHYATMQRDIRNELKRRKDADLCFTTLIDLYALPADFPGKQAAVRNPAEPRIYAQTLEKAFEEDIRDQRFVPHLQLHEYETILFADPDSFRLAFDDCDQAIEALKRVAASFPTLEHINDTPAGAPSRRIINLIPAYGGRKSSAGPDIAMHIGLPMIRSKCPHFDAWLTRLESILRS